MPWCLAVALGSSLCVALPTQHGNTAPVLVRSFEQIRRRVTNQALQTMHLMGWDRYRETEASANAAVSADGTMLEYEALVSRLVPPNVHVDNESLNDRSVLIIDSANRPGKHLPFFHAPPSLYPGFFLHSSTPHTNQPDLHLVSSSSPGTLVEVVQCLTELGLNISKARISSDGGWFVDGASNCVCVSVGVLWLSSCEDRMRAHASACVCMRTSAPVLQQRAHARVCAHVWQCVCGSDRARGTCPPFVLGRVDHSWASWPCTTSQPLK